MLHDHILTGIEFRNLRRSYPRPVPQNAKGLPGVTEQRDASAYRWHNSQRTVPNQPGFGLKLTL